MVHMKVSLFLVCSFIAQIQPRPTNEPGQNVSAIEPTIRSRDYEKALQRTIAVVEHKSALGRIVLLVCQKACKPLRSTVPQLIRDYNEQKDYVADDLIYYHYHYLRSQLPFYKVVKNTSQPFALYVSAGNVEEFNGNLNDQLSFASWLSSVDRTDVERPQSFTELDTYLNEVERCEKAYLLMVHDNRKCPNDFWRNTARVVYAGASLSTIILERPLENKVAVTLFRRLFSLPQQCLIITLLHDNQYSQPFSDIMPASVLQTVRNLMEFSTCLNEEEKLFTKKGIRSSLTDLQMEYFSTDYDLKRLEHKTSYIAVGLAGGIAVIALAISIFWGLNGSAFTKE